MTSLLPIVCCLVAAASQAAALKRLTVTTPPEGYAVVQFQLDETSSALAAAAVDLLVDGRKDQIVVVTPGARRPSYEALIGPLSAGSHEIRLEPSPLWPWDSRLRLTEATAIPVRPDDRRVDLFTHAPAIGLRSDTIGTASDLPLMMYVEDTTDRGARWLRYTIVFSNEDGGTAGMALMARWGRATDIELAYEVELRDGKVAQARYQGPDHRMLTKQPSAAPVPLLLVSTLNNMFLDRGHAAAVVRMVPELVDLSGRSRESVMDDRAWISRVMARELAQERPEGVGDARDYLYVDLSLESRSAGVALGARSPDGSTRWSDRGRSDLVVSRQGEMRIAIPVPAAEPVEALVVRCDPRPEPGQTQPSAGGPCAVSVRKAFRLQSDYAPGPTVVSPTRLTVATGTAHDVPTAPRIRSPDE